MTRLQVLGLVSFDQSYSTTRIISQITNCIQFESSPDIEGVRQRYDPDHDLLYLWSCPGPSYDKSVRSLLTLFLVSHHIFWLLQSRLDIESVRLLRNLQQLRSSLNVSQAPPSISFVVQAPSLSNDNLTLRFRAQTENTIRTVITPLSSNPPLFQTPIQKPALLTPSVSEVKTTRDQALQIKRFRQFAQTIVASARTRSSPIPQHLALWRTHAEKLQNTVQQTLSAIVSPVANNLRLFWDELLPGYAESAIRLYNESCTNGVYAQDIHQTNAKKSLEHIRANLPAHVYNQLEPVLLSQLEAIWTRSGRRKCSAISVTGRPCIHLFHQTEDLSAVPAAFGDVPKKRHSSGFLSLYSCGCGSVQVHLPDPFDLLEAQSSSLMPSCCESSLLNSPFSSWHIHKIERVLNLASSSRWSISRDDFVAITFELECESGHRFLHNFRDPVARLLSATSALIRDSFPPTDVPVILKCHQCRNISKNATARLRRVYIDTTNASIPIYLRPRVSVRCKRPEYHLKAIEERTEDNDCLDSGCMESYEMPARSLSAVSIPLAFPSSLGNNRAYRANSQHEIVIGRGILFTRQPDCDVRSC